MTVQARDGCVLVAEAIPAARARCPACPPVLESVSLVVSALYGALHCTVRGFPIVLGYLQFTLVLFRTVIIQIAIAS